MIPEDLSGIDRVRRAIALEHLDAEVVTPGISMPTVPLAAAAIGCHESQIIKTVVFTSPDEVAVVAIANGTRRINKATLAASAGVPNVKLASPGFVLERTGYPAGGVSPIGIRDRAAIVIIDESVLQESVVYGGAGTEDDLLRISTADLVRITSGRVTSITY